jgi:hypothetical protein
MTSDWGGIRAVKLRSAFIFGFVFICLTGAATGSAFASSISGTVTAEGGGPIEGVEVCPWPVPYAFETDCVETGADGHYSYPNLPAADYRISFSVSQDNLKYVNEYYDDTIAGEADLLHLGEGEDATVDAELAEGGSISGRVLDEANDQPIEGLWVCAWAEWVSRCGPTDAAGDYIVNGLPSDDYIVEFRSENIVNYLLEYYDNTDDFGLSTHVAVTAPAVTPEIDAKLAPGAEILGRLTVTGTGEPIRRELVCAEEPGFEGWQQAGCDVTDDSGNYAIRGLPAGTYIVSFGLEYAPDFGGLLVRGEWWHGAPSREEAEPITIAPPETRGGIDGHLPDPFAPFEPDPELSSSPPPAASTLPLVIKAPPKNCKKGFHRKLVKGKKRCVRKQRRHRHRKHR